MANFTYEQFEQEARNSGLYNSFSEADLNLAKSNPDAGMSILQYKKDYANATTDEARVLANQGAEDVRSSYGNYTGGTDGSGFYVNQQSPSSFTPEPMPEYTNNYSEDINNLWDKQQNYGSYEYGQAAPSYENRYDQDTQQLIDTILNREDFSYDASTNPLYGQYRKQYTREGQRAIQDAMGSAAAASGGIPSSYAMTAATQAGDYYMSQLTDKIPELYQQAYQRYLNEYQMKLSDLEMLQNAEKIDYNKFLNEMNQYNTDRNFDYGVWSDGYNRVNNDLQTGMMLEQQDYAKYQDRLNQHNIDREFAYGQHMDEINSQYADWEREYQSQNADWEKEYQIAVLAAEMGDYSKLKAMGIDTSNYANAGNAGSGGSGGGRYAGSSGNRGNSGGDSTASGSGTSGTAGSGMDMGLAGQLLRKYPDAVIPSGDASAMQIRYGITPRDLEDCGFTIKTTVRTS